MKIVLMLLQKKKKKKSSELYKIQRVRRIHPHLSPYSYLSYDMKSQETTSVLCPVYHAGKDQSRDSPG